MVLFNKNVDLLLALFLALIITSCGSTSQVYDNYEPVSENLTSEFRDIEFDAYAQYPNGFQGFMTDLMSNLYYPEELRREEIEGLVRLQFTVNVEGEIEDIEVLDAPEPSLGRAAERTLQNTKKWKPAYIDEEPVAVSYTAHIMYALRS